MRGPSSAGATTSLPRPNALSAWWMTAASYSSACVWGPMAMMSGSGLRLGMRSRASPAPPAAEQRRGSVADLLVDQFEQAGDHADEGGEGDAVEGQAGHQRTRTVRRG